MANQIMTSGQCSVAESLQLIFNYCAENKGKWKMEAAVELMETIVEVICSQIDETSAVL